MDTAKGDYEGTEIYSDLDTSKIESLPESQPHREVDITIVAAAQEGTGGRWPVSQSLQLRLTVTLFRLCEELDRFSINDLGSRQYRLCRKRSPEA